MLHKDIVDPGKLKRKLIESLKLAVELMKSIDEWAYDARKFR
jgi:hypothetical protein